MKTTRYHILAAALLMTGALLSACTNDETANLPATIQPNESHTIQFTATLAAKTSDAVTRAITKGKDGNNKEILNVTWKVNEKIAIYYQTGTTTYATEELTVIAVDDETGVATITGSLSDAINGGSATFVYPASLHDGAGGIDETKLRSGQLGTIANISKNYDAATATATLAVSGESATISGNIAMENKICICRFELNFMDGDNYVYEPMDNDFTITVGNDKTYCITSKNTDDPYAVAPVNQEPEYRGFQSGDVIYVAMLPFDSQTLTFEASRNVNSIVEHYRTVTNAGTLVKGTFYRKIPVHVNYIDSDVPDDNLVTGYHNTPVGILSNQTVVLKDATINVGSGSALSVGANTTIILVGTNTLTSTDGAGIHVGNGSSLTIKGSGSLTATGGYESAGIGGTIHEVCGDITIESGTVTASSSLPKSGQIVSTTNSGSGIGAGGGNASDQMGCGNITIGSSITKVTAISYNGTPIGANSGEHCGSITIDGTTNWSPGTATPNLYFDVDIKTWVLTHK